MNVMSFANLTVIDKSTGPLSKINGTLKGINQSANAIKNKKVDIKASISGEQKVKNDLIKIGLAKRDISKPINIKVNNRGLTNTKRLIEDILAGEAKLNATGVFASSKTRRPPIYNAVTGGTGGTGGGRPPRVPSGNYGGFYGGGFQNMTIGRALTGLTIVSAVINVNSAIINAAREGYTQNATSEFNLKTQQLSDKEKLDVNKSINSVFDGQSILSRDQVKKFFTENITSTLNPDGTINNKANEFLTKELISFLKAQVARGAKLDEAVEGAFNLSKAAQQSGSLNDNAGNFDPESASGFFNNIRRASVLIGKELTPQFIRMNQKYLRSSKYSLDNDNKLLALLLQEENGTTAAVGMNQMLKQLSLESIKDEQKYNLYKMGLVEGGKLSKKGGKTSVLGGEIVDKDLLNEAPNEWFSKYLIPAMKKVGLDPASGVDAKNFAGQISSDRTATDTITTFLVRFNELMAQIRRSDNIDPTAAKSDALTVDSPLVAIESIKSQWQGAFGVMLSALNDSFIIPGSSAIAGLGKSLQQFLTNPDGSTNKDNALIAGSAGIAGTAATFYATKLLMQQLTGAAALKVSATALTGSATQLSAAAAALSRSAGVSGAGNALSDTSNNKKGINSFKSMFGKVAAATVVGAVVYEMYSTGKGGRRGMTDDQFNKLIEYQKRNKTSSDYKNSPYSGPDDYKASIRGPWDGLPKIPDSPVIKAAKVVLVQGPSDIPAWAKGFPSNQMGPAGTLVKDLPLNGIPMISTFNINAVKVGAAAASIANAPAEIASTAGPWGGNAGTALQSSAIQWGNAAGAAIASAVGNLNIGVNNMQAAPASVNAPLARPKADTGIQSFGGPR